MFSNCSYISAESEYTFPNGSTLSLAIAREPGRIGWVTGRTYTMGATTVYSWQASHDALGRPVSTADSESAARTWTYNERSEMTGCTSSDGSYSYFYDSIGNRTSSSGAVGNFAPTTHSYTANFERRQPLVLLRFDRQPHVVLRHGRQPCAGHAFLHGERTQPVRLRRFDGAHVRRRRKSHGRRALQLRIRLREPARLRDAGFAFRRRPRHRLRLFFVQQAQKTVWRWCMGRRYTCAM